jgi:type I restriction-modification system DNA methylase subunit
LELTDLKTNFQSVLGIDNIDEIPQKIMQNLFSCKNEMFEKWLDFCDDLTKDYLQIIFQYYMADRKVKMQDYTPVSLARACVKVGETENAKSCYDMCSGSGALTIQAWNLNKNCKFICEEFDERVIPFLIFNLAIRNINGTVIHGDVLSGEKFKAWELTKGEKFSTITEIVPPTDFKTDICISNPPYNMKWKHEPFLQIEKRFVNYCVPPESNANFAFILSAMSVAKRSVLILPCCVLEGGLKEEKKIREILVEKNKIDSVIVNPENMFEATAIGTCLLVIDNDKTTAYTEFIDARQTYAEEKRTQRGQFGDKSHTNRVYEKTVKVYAEENIDKIYNAIKNRLKESEFSTPSTIESIENNKYSLSSAKYIEFVYTESEHRNYSDILADINRIATEKNCCKLVINETLAKRLGFDVELYKQDNLADTDFQDFIYKIAGDKPVKPDYISFTKNKNELVFKNNNSEFVSTILTSILQMWKQHIMYLNNEENRYLCEMRDALLPDLMSGKIEV